MQQGGDSDLQIMGEFRGHLIVDKISDKNKLTVTWIQPALRVY